MSKALEPHEARASQFAPPLTATTLRSAVADPADPANVRRVHLGFKTHLDVGFTDLAADVIRQYLDLLLPSVLDTTDRLRELNPVGPVKDRQGAAAGVGGPTMCWTTGSWLIERALCPKRGMPRADRDRLEQAIDRGDIVWHALPFTMHTELLDVRTLRSGIRMARRLDRRFGKTTRAAKCTDVPGHTRGIVGPLVDAGVELLHVGVNPGSTMPAVPERFRWIDGGGRSLGVVYTDDYARPIVNAAGDAVFCLIHAGDNRPAPDADAVTTCFTEAASACGHAWIGAGSLETLLDELRPEIPGWPAVTREIGDSWVHGVAADPPKLAAMRVLLREGRRLRRAGVSRRRLQRFDEALLLLAEHTWGLDEKTHLADFRRRTPEAFATARRADQVPPHDDLASLPPVLRGKGDTPEPRAGRTYAGFEASWAEQRGYVGDAIAAVPMAHRIRVQHRVRLAMRPDPYATPPTHAADLDAWNALGLQLVVRYEVYAAADFSHWLATYSRNTHQFWVNADFGKPGLEHDADVPADAWTAELNPDGGALDLPAMTRDHRTARPPRRVQAVVKPTPTRRGLRLHVEMHDKPENRWPEALWLGLLPANGPEAAKPPTAVGVGLTVDKIGQRVAVPGDVVPEGGGSLHAVGKFAELIHGPDAWRIVPLDTPVVTDDPRRLIDPIGGGQREHALAPSSGAWFCVHNNVWSTNFPMWCGGDWRARFGIAAVRR